MSRWWNMFTVLPYPDRIALKLVSFCPGKVIIRTLDMTLCDAAVCRGTSRRICGAR